MADYETPPADLSSFPDSTDPKQWADRFGRFAGSFPATFLTREMLASWFAGAINAGAMSRYGEYNDELLRLRRVVVRMTMLAAVLAGILLAACIAMIITGMRVSLCPSP